MSIYNSIRSSKVTTGNAPQYQGMRIFDEDAQVCPARSNVSDYGVGGVARDTINTQTAGCFSPLNRMEIENMQRPQYSTYLNAQAINTAGVGDDYVKPNFQYAGSKPHYDTLLGQNYIRNTEDAPKYKLSQFKSTAPVNKQLQEANKISCIMNRTYEGRSCQANY